MKGSPDLPSKLAIDSSVLIAYFLGEPTGELAKREILGQRRATYCSHVALSETFYILCRARNHQFALDALETLEKTGFVKFYDSTQLDYEAGMQKCARRISLADCYVLALAKNIRGAAVFAHHEKDVSAELKKNPPAVAVLFLEDLTARLGLAA
jgi:predicted nucleic acid-binding protein